MQGLLDLLTNVGGLAGFGGQPNGNPDTQGRIMGGGDNPYGGLMIDDSAGSADPLPEPSFWEKLMMGPRDSDMTAFGKSRDVSQDADIGELLRWANQMKVNQSQSRQRQPNRIGSMYDNPYIQSLLGG